MRELARLLSVLLSIYNILIIIRIIFLWFRPVQPYRQERGDVSSLLGRIVDPYLNLFKSIPFLHVGAIDFTPLAAIMVVGIVQRIAATFALTGRLSIGYILAIIVQSLWWSVGSLLFGLFAILVGLRLVFSYRRSRNTVQFIAILDQWLRRPLDFIHRLFFQGREISDRQLLWTTLIVTIVAYILVSLVVNLLIRLLVGLPF